MFGALVFFAISCAREELLSRAKLMKMRPMTKYWRLTLNFQYIWVLKWQISSERSWTVTLQSEWILKKLRVMSGWEDTKMRQVEWYQSRSGRLGRDCPELNEFVWMYYHKNSIIISFIITLTQGQQNSTTKYDLCASTYITQLFCAFTAVLSAQTYRVLLSQVSQEISWQNLRFFLDRRNVLSIFAYFSFPWYILFQRTRTFV